MADRFAEPKAKSRKPKANWARRIFLVMLLPKVVCALRKRSLWRATLPRDRLRGAKDKANTAAARRFLTLLHG